MAADQGSGLYCSTAGAFFDNKDELTEHYRSDFHRYNLKRKIAGLPPVTREWYEVRKAQLLATSATPVQKVWFDPLTRRKFYSENTYLAFARSKKYQELVRKSGEPAPAPIVTLRKVEEAQQAQQPQQQAQPAQQAAGFTMKPAVKSAAAAAQQAQQAAPAEQEGEEVEEDGEADEGSDWETASEEEMATDQKWEEWDVRRSLFDNHVSASMEDNLEYMFKNFGFYFPDSQFLSDPEGLLKYLGAKLQYGHVPLYESGDNPNAKQFQSLHAVQRHMVDTNRCKMAFEDNEEEYEDFYNYGDEEGDAEMGQAGALILSEAEAGPSASYELVLAGGSGGHGGVGTKIIGSREFARYYRQRPRLEDNRASVQAAMVQAQYRRLAVPLLEGPPGEAIADKKREKRAQFRSEKRRLKYSIDNYDKIHNLPKNVTY
ncbi:zinc finger protein [Chlorella sorokiniana]|uniref:Zinc finger protein n=1 Tax=Chlorella sorokiniana TaxID=3076 RepID=A0A2P6TLT4_CHLSO|nr:zinc finger protein [Chlorella sorokiniana]|eukprot:PRW45252.1 zinc finger protein [Chlorella sorokiniana]